MNSNITDTSKRHIFIVGCKGIPTRYGGFETFVDKLTEYTKDESIQYHVSRILDDSEMVAFIYYVLVNLKRFQSKFVMKEIKIIMDG